MFESIYAAEMDIFKGVWKICVRWPLKGLLEVYYSIVFELLKFSSRLISKAMSSIYWPLSFGFETFLLGFGWWPFIDRPLHLQLLETFCLPLLASALSNLIFLICIPSSNLKFFYFELNITSNDGPTFISPLLNLLLSKFSKVLFLLFTWLSN